VCGKVDHEQEQGATVLTTMDLNAPGSPMKVPSTAAYRLELPANPWRQAAADIKSGALAWQSWGMLGWHDIRQRYRRSTLGPFWITITMGVSIGSIGLIFGTLFGQDLHYFLPFVAAGNIVWALLSSLLTDGCAAFVSSEPIIRQIKLPYSMHIFRVVWRNLIILAHNIWVFVATVILFAAWPNSATWLAIPGLVLIVINGSWVALILGLISARFRDIPLIITSMLQLLYLATPIIWLPDSMRGKHSYVYEYNPLYHMIELIRAPLLGHAPTLANWGVGIALALVGWALTYVLFARFRWRIPYWI
jgi:homopolymeric O-antigen transport system permease protein